MKVIVRLAPTAKFATATSIACRVPTVEIVAVPAPVTVTSDAVPLGKLKPAGRTSLITISVAAAL
ncbi:hypothetical protein MGSAQ_000530 [marine sediment metagenome]|uniref:Uncharacterized protein n=1 Tax=marine sediment metagenome TaxID=412755 RepID=A0A1B6NWZ4_9ZZZZ